MTNKLLVEEEPFFLNRTWRTQWPKCRSRFHFFYSFIQISTMMPTALQWSVLVSLLYNIQEKKLRGDWKGRRWPWKWMQHCNMIRNSVAIWNVCAFFISVSLTVFICLSAILLVLFLNPLSFFPLPKLRVQLRIRRRELRNHVRESFK